MPCRSIYYEDDVPGEWNQFGEINAGFFQTIGSPGGASKVGATDADHPTVVALPKAGE